MGVERQSYLLDTHAFIWSISEPEMLGSNASRIISDASNKLVVSAASALEISIKTRRGKLAGGGTLVARFEDLVAELGASLTPITARHALLAGRLDWGHRDPFDRVLAATCMIDGCSMITKDQEITRFNEVATTW